MSMTWSPFCITTMAGVVGSCPHGGGKKYAKEGVYGNFRVLRPASGCPPSDSYLAGELCTHPGPHTVLGVAHARVSLRNLRSPIECSGCQCANSHSRVRGQPCTMRCLACAVYSVL